MEESFGKGEAENTEKDAQRLRELETRNRFLEQQNRILQREAEAYRRSLDETRGSYTYRIGRAITFFPRMVRQTVRRIRGGQNTEREKMPLPYTFKIENGSLNITHELDGEETAEVSSVFLKHIFWGGRIDIPMAVGQNETDRILWLHNMTEEEFSLTGEYLAKGPATGVICAYTSQDTDHIFLLLLSTPEQMYKRFVRCKYDTAKVKLKRKQLLIHIKGYVTTQKKSDISVESGALNIDANHSFELSFSDSSKGKKFDLRRKIDISSIISQETEINNPIQTVICICGIPCTFNVGKKKKSKKPTKFFYLPLSCASYSDWILFIRRNIHQNFTLVVRQKEEEEKELSFRILESKPVSAIMYYFGKLCRCLRRKKINLYFEKNSMKAEEGTYQLFEKAASVSDTSNYFILDKRSAQWETLSKNKNVAGKYTLFYYWLLYTSDCFISTETSSHLNVHRAKNYYVRKALLERPLIFLQHGVTYLKRQGAGSVFGKGKEGEPLYMAVGSDKEKNIVCEMLKIAPEQCMKTGLPIFDTIPYMHINEHSPDTVTVMFTWKPSEEHLLAHFEDSFYYRSIRRVYSLLTNYISPEQIRIVPHPKVLSLLSSTDMRPQIWNGTIADVLYETKLLITDYSSVCYNAFYQGAAILFYQPDLEAYEKEVGKLIPNDEEYIGHRAFDLDKVKELLDAGIKNGKISLSFFRRERDVEMYKTINEFSDGKNNDRILNFLKEKGIL